MDMLIIVIIGSVIGGALCGTIIALSSDVISRRSYKQNIAPVENVFEKKINYRKYGIIQ